MQINQKNNMKIATFENEESWKSARLGKITGSVLKDIIVKRGTGKKKGFYQLIADRIAVPRDDENRMDRGHRLESEAIDKFEKQTGKTVVRDLVIWERDDMPNIAISPDGYIMNDGKVAEAVEVKCLNSASHIEAIITGEYPSEYKEQIIQYFVVNDELEILHFVMYDPTVTREYIQFDIKRNDIAEEIQFHYDYQVQTLQEVEEWVNKLTF